ncbi:MAG TPA: ATP-binding protein [Lachnospiraceae bacterium]|nr:ATP-binding protein [Lachnospiraceae bacterium]
MLDKTDYEKKGLLLGIQKHKFERNIIILVFIMILCTLVAKLLPPIRMSGSNIVMIYILGIQIFSFLAEGYYYSLCSSICAVLLYNFFFTEPYYTFKVNNPDYLITFMVMFFVGFTTSMLTIRFKFERKLVEERERSISALYNIERKLLNVKGWEELAKISAEELAKQMNTNVLLTFFHSTGYLLCRVVEGEDVFSDDLDTSACLEAYQSGNCCGHSTTLFSEAIGFYTPILSQSGVLGVIGVSVKGQDILTSAQISFLEVVAPQIAVVLERERFFHKQQQTKMEMQSERLRSDMLRTISHDLRTPLASIMGLTSTALSNYNTMSDDIKKDFMQSIYEDADWLNELVENILQTTRFEEKRIKLNMEQEAAEEIITEAVTHVRKHDLKHQIRVQIPDEVIIVKADGVLLRQVIVNILNNAINYSPADSDIIVTLHREDNRAIFEVKDKGPGVDAEVLPHIFERYYRGNTRMGRNRKGMGLGLALCKSIIKAHNGEISIRSNEPNGTIVSFYLIAEREVTDGTFNINS